MPLPLLLDSLMSVDAVLVTARRRSSVASG